MKDETAYFWSHINQDLVGRKICLEDSSDHGSSASATISGIRLARGILTIMTINCEVKLQNGTVNPTQSSNFTGTIANIIDPNVLVNGNIVFHVWAGYDSVVIYPTEKK